MSDAATIDVLARLQQAAEKTAAADPQLVKLLLAGGAGAAGGAGLGSYITKKREEDAHRRAKNVGFGAGVATGLAGPRIVDLLHTVLHRGDQ